jgi:hypothetical protein
VSRRRAWILDLDPSGTGAEMRPLDSVLREPEAEPDLALVRRPPAEPADDDKPPEPAAPHRFKVVDVLSGQVRVEDAGARATVTLLKGVRSIGDVRVYVWEPDGERWRLLTLAEQRALWALRDR